MSRRLVRWFGDLDPERRRCWAARLLVLSVVAGVLNMAGWLAGWISPELMDAITNLLSWLAITFTCADLLATTDVRKEQDEES